MEPPIAILDSLKDLSLLFRFCRSENTCLYQLLGALARETWPIASRLTWRSFPGITSFALESSTMRASCYHVSQVLNTVLILVLLNELSYLVKQSLQ